MKTTVRTYALSVVLTCMIVIAALPQRIEAGGIPVIDAASLTQNTLTAVRMLEEIGISTDQLASLVEQIEQLYELQRLQNQTIDAVTGVLEVSGEIKAHFDRYGSSYLGQVIPENFVAFLRLVADGKARAKDVVAVLDRIETRYPKYTSDQFDGYVPDSRTGRVYQDAEQYARVSAVMNERIYDDSKATLAASRKILESPAGDIAAKLDKLAMQNHANMMALLAESRAQATANTLEAHEQRMRIESRKQFHDDWELSGK